MRHNMGGAGMTGEAWDQHYYRILGGLRQSGVYAGQEATQRQIAENETVEQFGERPQEATP